MRTILAFVALIAITHIAGAQISDADMEAKLIELAWKNNPLTRISEAEVDLARQEARVVGAEWSNLLGATGNLNEFNIKQFTNPDSNATGNTFFPRYNVFVRIPFSLFVETPRKKKVALAKINLADEKVNLTRMELKAKVQRLYSDYLRNRETWIIRQEILSKEKTNFERIEKDYLAKTISLESYTSGARVYNEHRIQELNAKSEYLKSKIGIEELIGMRLEDIK